VASRGSCRIFNFSLALGGPLGTPRIFLRAETTGGKIMHARKEWKPLRRSASPP
jgi:hypothetical protein